MPEFLLNVWEQYLSPFFMSYWSEIVLLVILVFAIRHSEDTNPYADLSNSLSKTALEALKDTFDRIGKSLRLDSPEDHAETISQHLSELFKAFYVKADDLLKSSIESIKAHKNEIFLVFGTDSHIRAWRIAGALITAILLAVFVLADVIQAAFSLSETAGFSGITRRFLTDNPSLDNLPLSIMISSVGTAATLGFILIDMWGISKFIR